MKRTLLALYLLSRCPTFGQIPIDSFFRDGSQWTQFIDYEYWATSSKSRKGTASTTLTIAGDTTVGGITYKKLYRGSKGGYYRLSEDNITRYLPATDPKHKYIGRLRVEDKKVYFTSDQDPSFLNYYTPGVETLLYDFGLNVGDTFRWQVVTRIDSVLVQGQYQKKFIFHFDDRYIIEGLGWHYGLMSEMELFIPPTQGSTDYGLCFSSGNIFYHYKPTCPGVNWYLLEKCFDMDALAVAPGAQHEELTIYPNPTQSRFTLTGTCPANVVKLSIINMLGILVHTEVLSVENSRVNHHIDISGLPNGMYRAVVSADTMQKIIPLVKE